MGKVQAGMILVDGFAMGDFRDLVLRDRQHLASDGLVIIVVARSAQDGQIVGELEVVFRGFAHAGDLDELTEKAKKRVLEALAGAEMTQASDITVVKTQVHDVLQKFLHKEVGRTADGASGDRRGVSQESRWQDGPTVSRRRVRP